MVTRQVLAAEGDTALAGDWSAAREGTPQVCSERGEDRGGRGSLSVPVSADPKLGPTSSKCHGRTANQ